VLIPRRPSILRAESLLLAHRQSKDNRIAIPAPTNQREIKRAPGAPIGFQTETPPLSGRAAPALLTEIVVLCDVVRRILSLFLRRLPSLKPPVVYRERTLIATAESPCGQSTDVRNQFVGSAYTHAQESGLDNRRTARLQRRDDRRFASLYRLR